jgi:hypothetical protein
MEPCEPFDLLKPLELLEPLAPLEYLATNGSTGRGKSTWRRIRRISADFLVV